MIWEELERELPPVALFLGPPGAGQWPLAERLAFAHGFAAWDIYRLRAVTAVEVREVHQFSLTASSAPAGKLVLLGLDGAGPGALNALLKLLEEPPPGVRFILVASPPVLATIESRSTVFRFGAGAAGEVDSVARDRVVSALRAAVAGDLPGIRRAFRGRGEDDWGDTEHELLGVWVAECASERWRVFRAGEVQASPQAARRLARVLGDYAFARPRVVDRLLVEYFATIR